MIEYVNISLEGPASKIMAAHDKDGPSCIIARRDDIEICVWLRPTPEQAAQIVRTLAPFAGLRVAGEEEK